MRLHRYQTTWMVWSMAAGVAATAWAQSATRPAGPEAAPERSGRQTGVVTGNDVYVRSGSDQNYYPVTKLHRGDEVVVVGEQFGWLEILPPTGTHSLIDKTYVELAEGDDAQGTVNGSIWVLAGSELNNRRYAKQVRLSRGDRVEILGTTSDGAFYKIVPPRGATLWISGDFVDRSGTAAVARAESPRSPTIERVRPGELDLSAAEPAAPGAPEEEMRPVPSPVVRPPTEPARSPETAERPQRDDGRFQMKVNAIEAELAAESAKPIRHQQLQPIIVRLDELAEETNDELTRLYARTRAEQLREHIQMIAAVQELSELQENAIATANEIKRERARLVAEQAISVDDIIVRGEIEVSGIYDGVGARPKRWRVVSPSGQVRQTIAYIEVPPGSPIDPVQFYGKFVGIRARERQLLRGTVPPIPVYTVEEIVVLDPAAERSQHRSPAPRRTAPGTGVHASPEAIIVRPPETQPAGEPVRSPEPRADD